MDFVSSITTAPVSVDLVFNRISDLRNIDSIKEKTGEKGIEIKAIDENSCLLQVNNMAQVTMRIVDRSENKHVKLESDNSPVPLTLWVQLLPHQEIPNRTLIKVTLRAELNFLLKGILQKPMQEGVEKLAQLLALIDYTS